MGFPPFRVATKQQSPRICLLGPLPFFSGLGSLFVKESRIYLRNYDYIAPLGAYTPELNSRRPDAAAWNRLLPRRNAIPLHTIRVGQRRLELIRSVGSVIRLSVHRHYKIMPQSNLCLKCLFPLRYVLFLLYISCQFLFLIDISPCCLLITRVTD